MKNKTFFFANYEGLRQRVTQTFTDSVPSAAYKSRSTIPSVNLLLAAYPAGTLRSSDAGYRPGARRTAASLDGEFGLHPRRPSFQRPQFHLRALQHRRRRTVLARARPSTSTGRTMPSARPIWCAIPADLLSLGGQRGEGRLQSLDPAPGRRGPLPPTVAARASRR